MGKSTHTLPDQTVLVLDHIESVDPVSSGVFYVWMTGGRFYCHPPANFPPTPHDDVKAAREALITAIEAWRGHR